MQFQLHDFGVQQFGRHKLAPILMSWINTAIPLLLMDFEVAPNITFLIHFSFDARILQGWIYREGLAALQGYNLDPMEDAKIVMAF